MTEEILNFLSTQKQQKYHFCNNNGSLKKKKYRNIVDIFTGYVKFSTFFASFISSFSFKK